MGDIVREIYCEEKFFKLELLIEFINNHNIKVISIFPNIYNKTYQEYILIYSYMEEWFSLEEFLNWLPYTGIVFIDFILGFLYLVLGILAFMAIGALGLFVLGFLMMTCYIWIPLLLVVVGIMKLCGL